MDTTIGIDRDEQDYLFAGGSGLAITEDVWKRAACRDAEPEIFFPISDRDVVSRTAALRVCSGCTIRSECLEVAMRDRSLLGIWGGTTEADRERLRRPRRVAVA